ILQEDRRKASAACGIYPFASIRRRIRQPAPGQFLGRRGRIYPDIICVTRACRPIQLSLIVLGTSANRPTAPTRANNAPKKKTEAWPTRSHNSPAITLARSCSRPTVVLYQPTPLARRSLGTRSDASALPTARKTPWYNP